MLNRWFTAEKLAALVLAVSCTTIAATATDAAPRTFPAVDAGETITVTTLEDRVDFTGSQQVSDLPGPDGLVSFREAVTATNNTPGPQTIGFAIPPSTFFLTPGVGLLRIENGQAFSVTDAFTTIDFSTQTAAFGDTNPEGPEIGFFGSTASTSTPAIILSSDDNVVKGMGDAHYVSRGIWIFGSRNRVIGCQIGGPIYTAVEIDGSTELAGGPRTVRDNVIGGTEPGEGNVLSGLTIHGSAENNIVIGNPLLRGVSIHGQPEAGKINRNTRIGGPTPAERNVIAREGHFTSQGAPTGTQVAIWDAEDTLIEGNFIGTTADGMQVAVNQIGPVGVGIYRGERTIVRNNVIAGFRVQGRNHYANEIFGQAVSLYSTDGVVRDTVIRNNLIGLAVDGVTPIRTYQGVVVPDSVGTTINTLIDSNHIGGIETNGILVEEHQGVTLTRNSIHDCGGLGIDLSARWDPDGPTPNDAGDADAGGNGLQNYPALQSATIDGSSITIQGTLSTSSSDPFRIEFFASPSCDPSGYGEGKSYLGTTTVTTNASGQATFSTTLQASVAPGSAITATATRISTGDTSEFSACITALTDPPPVAKASVTSAPGNAPLLVQFSSNGSSAGRGSIAAYHWNFGDGSTSALANPSHLYAANGTYTATLTITNDAGLTDSDRVTVVVESSLRSTGIVLSSAAPANKATVTGQVAIRDAAGATVTGALVKISWETPEGEKIESEKLTDPKGIASFTVTSSLGKYKLTVVDVTRSGYKFDAANSVLGQSMTATNTRRGPIVGPRN